ncbi:PDR/VanB family oxidoreductase [Conexibacter sp. JD483]|uniref:PDR/VanB family oxidoreductase n=1 Tax=unclassified Conexibacter TaxID=2627773 RepID=UPI0027227DE9|nr:MULTISPECIES: PDR/VanB family oxidoreductase [unclassified Conexibacter]MDO8186912.1 PDR/VanB family oxidoreductase [Conexibacter sp. CPCC 205706]MDO8200776.1 PDR/VanB family oxidoreductase [Conexibacter sp. CPCC 205762]MDR9371986.1 PDR/VanB family oxidoreductase [Conexibacter sp. JD483]
MSDFEVVTTQLTLEADGIVSVRLERVDGQPLPAWQPGAHVDLVLPVGITRQYSLIDSPADLSSYRIAVLQQRNSRGGSEYVHVFLRPGQRVRIGAPRNHFSLDPADEYRFIGGGIGITPLLSMARAADARDADWRLHYGGRSLRSMAYRRELRAAYGDRVELWPSDLRGRLPLDELLSAPSRRTLVYCCGPEQLIEAVRETAARVGWAQEDVRFERFAPTVHEHAPDRAFEVEARRSGTTVAIEQGESLLDGLLRAGIGVSSSCRSGVCGACETRVIEGAVEHRDDILSAAQRAAGEAMMVCVSRARGDRLVLDV